MKAAIRTRRLRDSPSEVEGKSASRFKRVRAARWPTFGLVVVCLFETAGRSEEPAVTEPTPSLAARMEAPVSLKPAFGKSASDILKQRLSYSATNYFTMYNLIGPFQEALQQRLTASEVLGEPMAQVLKRAGRESAREIVLRGMRVEDLLESVFPDRFRNFIYYSLLDRKDLGKLRNPFDPSEGVPGLERNEPGRFPRHSNFQLHPFRTDPAADLTIRTRKVDFGVRASVQEAGVVAVIPLTESWVVTQAFKCEEYNHKTLYASFGISKVVKAGYFTASVRVPVVARADPENQPQFVAGFQKRF